MEGLIRKFLEEKPGYLKKSDRYILERLDLYPLTEKRLKKCANVKRELRAGTYLRKKKGRHRHKPVIKTAGLPRLQPHRGLNPKKILVIGDIHEPFSLAGYLEFCHEMQLKHDCGTVIFIGDIIDNHYASYHESDPDGYSAGQELDRAIDRIKMWYQAFPKATVIIGNHDRLVYRKAFSSGVSRRWIRTMDEVLGTPGWDFVEQIELYNIDFNHGEGGTAKTRMKNEMMSQVQGHRHGEFYIHYNISPITTIFGMQVGCGVDRKAYAMAYGKHFKKPSIGLGMVDCSDEQPVPHIIPMPGVN